MRSKCKCYNYSLRCHKNAVVGHLYTFKETSQTLNINSSLKASLFNLWAPQTYNMKTRDPNKIHGLALDLIDSI